MNKLLRLLKLKPINEAVFFYNDQTKILQNILIMKLFHKMEADVQNSL